MRIYRGQLMGEHTEATCYCQAIGRGAAIQHSRLARIRLTEGLYWYRNLRMRSNRQHCKAFFYIIYFVYLFLFLKKESSSIWASLNVASLKNWKTPIGKQTHENKVINWKEKNENIGLNNKNFWLWVGKQFTIIRCGYFEDQFKTTSIQHSLDWLQSINQSITPSINQSIHLSIHPSIIHPSIRPFINKWMNESINQSINQSTNQSINRSKTDYVWE